MKTTKLQDIDNDRYLGINIFEEGIFLANRLDYILK